MVNADNPTNVQLPPGMYNKQENARVPIIVTEIGVEGIGKRLVNSNKDQIDSGTFYG